MDRVAVFVDAGYVFAQGSVLLGGKKLPRSRVVLEHEAAVQAFGEFASKISSMPLLRIYWYDGTSTGPTAQHLTLAHLPNIKLRLGFVNSVGEQKGVDSHQLPRDVDRQLLAGGRSAILRDLGPAEKKQIRQRFVDVCRLRLAEGDG